MAGITRRVFVSILLALSLAGCAAGARQQGAVATSGDDGSSIERAVVLSDAKNEAEGVRAEHAWVQSHYPGWSWGTQYLLNHEGRPYDEIEISRGGEHRTIYFDISNWFGQL